MNLNKGQNTRQKMINLMYLVFIAMLALNISTEVLDGFDLIYEKLRNTIQNVTIRNNQLYSELESEYKANQQKTQDAYKNATDLRHQTDSLFNYIQNLKEKIAEISDGKDADVTNIESRENVDAASEVMLSPFNGQGVNLRKAINLYRDNISKYVADPSKRKIVENSLSTEPTQKAKKDNKNWEQGSFEQMPSIAAITYLTEIQANLKTAEGEALNSIIKNIDISDFRVNELNAYVIPESNVVMTGMNYKANIVIAAVDTTQRPHIVVDGKVIDNGVFQIIAGNPGSHTLSGFMELMSPDGTPWKREFTHKYTVIEQTATIAPLMMDVVYAGIDNPISISVPGIVTNDVSASALGGTLTKSGTNWVARPTTIGGNFVVNVFANVNGSQRKVAEKKFRIRALPDPSAYVEFRDGNGNLKRHKTGTLARNTLLNAGGIKAAIDDGILDIPFTVLSFRTITTDAMGNNSPELSSGNSFSSRQIEQIKRIERGKTLFIAEIKVKGPDGVERQISPIEIRLN